MDTLFLGYLVCAPWRTHSCEDLYTLLEGHDTPPKLFTQPPFGKFWIYYKRILLHPHILFLIMRSK